jgi:hypothetical protein
LKLRRMPKKMKKISAKASSLSGDVKLPLTGFRATFVPDVESIKLVYSDYRVITAAVNQAEYVYRLNSCFDPDFTGVGGQPDGFDFWKTYYTIYRVMAAKVEVQAVSNTIDGNGLLAIAATDSSGSYLSAEEVAGLRKSKAATFTQQKPASLRASWHIGELFGRNDDSILADSECAALTTASPTAVQYLHVAVESGNSATQATMVWTKITYYVRFERAIATLDSATRHRLRFQRASLLPTTPGPSTAGASVAAEDWKCSAKAADVSSSGSGPPKLDASLISSSTVLALASPMLDSASLDTVDPAQKCLCWRK